MAIYIRRRAFIGVLGGAAAWPLAAWAQQPVPVIGFLRDSSAEGSAAIISAFQRGVKEAGLIEGQNVIIEYRWSEGQYDRLPSLASELVRHRVAALVGAGEVAAIAAKAVTTAIPIVFVTGDDPVQMGIVASLNRPGDNITGVTFHSGNLGVKGIELLHELVPTATAIGLLVNTNSPAAKAQVREAQEATHALGLRLELVNAHNENDVDFAFAALEQKRVGALLIPGNAVFTGQRDQLVALAARYRLPTMQNIREFVTAGGLMSYSASITDAYRQAGVYIGRILKGARPADLPVMQSVKFELMINLKTAKSLGLTIPTSLLVAAEDVIE
jgi:putative ABC transport system substrate-binding protein